MQGYRTQDYPIEHAVKEGRSILFRHFSKDPEFKTGLQVISNTDKKTHPHNDEFVVES